MSDYKVGYKRPPRETQFQPGHSSKGGRPRQSRSLREILTSEVSERVTVTENGREKQVSKMHLLMKMLFNKSILGDVAAWKQLYPLLKQYGLTADRPINKDDWNDPEMVLGVIERLMHRMVMMKKAHLLEALLKYRERFTDGRSAFLEVMRDEKAGLLKPPPPKSA